MLNSRTKRATIVTQKESRKVEILNTKAKISKLEDKQNL